jgi:hypothetical protein
MLTKSMKPHLMAQNSLKTSVQAALVKSTLKNFSPGFVCGYVGTILHIKLGEKW